MRKSLIALSLLAGMVGAHAAGQVEVSFKPVQALRDAGAGPFDGERNLQTLAAHFKALGAKLPDGQTLKVEVLDLDLAGEVKPLRRGGDIRVLRGGADWPSMTLRYTLSAEGRTLRSAEERISDMNYLMHPVRGRGDGALAYETRLVDQWFADRFSSAAMAAR